MIDSDLLATRLQITEVRGQMSASILMTGSYDAQLKIENDALSCSLAGLQETLQCLKDQLDLEEQSRQKEIKQIQDLKAKNRA
jgi:hypothetical protein